jgi:hypothetical protein
MPTRSPRRSAEKNSTPLMRVGTRIVLVTALMARGVAPDRFYRVRKPLAARRLK